MNDFLMVLVTVVIVLRLPAVRSAQQRPLWLMLVIMEVGHLAGFPVVAKMINGVSGVPQLADLTRGLAAVALSTALLHLAVHFHGADQRGRTTRFVLAAITMAGQITCFGMAITSGDPLRPGFAPTPGALNWVMGYWFFFLTYMIGTRFVSSVLFWRLLPRVRSLPRVGILLLALATAVSLVYLLSRIGSLFSTAVWLRDIGHFGAATSLALLALGASLAALAPLRESFVDWLDCRRLHPLWHDLVTAFPHIALQPSRSSMRMRLQRRIIETRDGMLSLREWITPADEVDGDSAESTARWIRLALQRMRDGEPKSPVVLDLVRHGGTDTETELRWLRELARAYRASAGDALPGAKDRAHVQ
ncbi:hypothetical protein LFM09_11960 [Lentzea alba]|uniref:MAB_1171c family putative transporter n=1 Tax=Lentzea alba TaxID=2714351 RepID=UPI0039BF9756